MNYGYQSFQYIDRRVRAGKLVTPLACKGKGPGSNLGENMFTIFLSLLPMRIS